MTCVRFDQDKRSDSFVFFSKDMDRHSNNVTSNLANNGTIIERNTCKSAWCYQPVCVGIWM